MTNRLFNMPLDVASAANASALRQPGEAARARVDVWVVAAEELAPRLLTRVARRLESSDRHRVRRLVGGRARREHLAGRALARAVLWARFGAAAEAWRFTRTAAGRPHVAGDAGRGRFDFNVSHAGGLVCCALIEGPGRVGVDLERCDRALDAEALATTALSPDERAGLAACEPGGRRVHLLRLLTLKEAYLKALGCGLTVRPRGVAFDLGPDDGQVRLRGPEGARWRFATRARGGFVLAVAAETGAALALCLHPGGALCRAADQTLADLRSAA